DKTTTIAAGTLFEARGVDVRGVDWRVEVGEGATFVLDLASVEVGDAFTVVLAKGATVRVTDARLKAGSVLLKTTDGGSVVLRDVILDTPTPEIHEGPVTPDAVNVFRVAAPTTTMPPEGTGGAPEAPTPAGGADVAAPPGAQPPGPTPAAPSGETR
ncbi:MAG: hypothetical protein ACK4YP_24160, partial [Myxococcota bacterium]